MKRINAILLGIIAGSLMATANAADVEFHTSKGKMVFMIDETNAPVTAKNFIDYVNEGFYDGLIFHRVIPGFVIQGGGFAPGMEQKKTNPPIINEADNGLQNKKYTLSMARTNDPNSATSQFFINLNDNASLDKNPASHGYAVFGEVVEGTEVVDAIAQVKTGPRPPFGDVPVEDIVIEKAVLVKE